MNDDASGLQSHNHSQNTATIRLIRRIGLMINLTKNQSAKEQQR